MERCCFVALVRCRAVYSRPLDNESLQSSGDDLTTMTDRTCSMTQKHPQYLYNTPPPSHLTHPPLCNRANIDTEKPHHIQYRTISTQNRCLHLHTLLLHPIPAPPPRLLGRPHPALLAQRHPHPEPAKRLDKGKREKHAVLEPLAAPRRRRVPRRRVRVRRRVLQPPRRPADARRPHGRVQRRRGREDEGVEREEEEDC